ncbi:unnamed protein product [Pleuronectes platessa]|uniref:Uncharacterized protein n=1 Tax=Pleuronectes platessa TaxID=8262 RepID=A0A9N7UUQ8_PLEPL|nr:unnamed protein product [Pleuronectes platessa]
MAHIVHPAARWGSRLAHNRNFPSDTSTDASSGAHPTCPPPCVSTGGAGHRTEMRFQKTVRVNGAASNRLHTWSDISFTVVIILTDRQIDPDPLDARIPRANILKQPEGCRERRPDQKIWGGSFFFAHVFSGSWKPAQRAWNAEFLDWRGEFGRETSAALQHTILQSHDFNTKGSSSSIIA